MHNIKTIEIQKIKRILLPIIFSVCSIAIGFLIANYGCELSFLENDEAILGCIITLFGFSLTSTIFIYQTVLKENSDTCVKLVKALANTLLLMFVLIVVAVITNFVLQLIVDVKWHLVLKTLYYAAIVYFIISEFDVMLGFITIIRSVRINKKENQ